MISHLDWNILFCFSFKPVAPLESRNTFLPDLFSRLGKDYKLKCKITFLISVDRYSPCAEAEQQHRDTGRYEVHTQGVK